MPQKEFYVKHVDNSSCTGLINGGEASFSLGGTTMEKFITNVIFDPIGLSRLPSSAKGNSITIKYDGKLGNWTSQVGCKLQRQHFPDNYTINGNIFTFSGDLAYSTYSKFVMPDFTSESYTTQETSDVNFPSVYVSTGFEKGCIVSLWAKREDKNYLFDGQLFLKNLRLVVDYIANGNYVARTTGVGMSGQDYVSVSSSGYAGNTYDNIEIAQNTDARFIAHATEDRTITKVICKDLDGIIWTKTAKELENEGLLQLNRKLFDYTSTSGKCTELELEVHFGRDGSNVYVGDQLFDVYLGNQLMDVYVGNTLI